MIKVEYSIDNGKAWKTWAFFHDDQKYRAEQMKSRLVRLYSDRDWDFRIVPTDKADEPELRKLLLIQQRDKKTKK